MPTTIIGLDHIYLAVSDFDRSERFYDQVMAELGFRKGDKPIGGERHAHYFNPVLAISIRPARGKAKHDPYSPGLHHLCLQVASAEDVDGVAASLEELGVELTPPKRYLEYHPEYYATFFEDPDGIRLEVVARTSKRQEIAERWDDLETFLNPIDDLHRRERGD